MNDADPRALRAAFGAFLTGVTVVTARRDDGVPVGFTANSYTSVSMDPPLLLVCPARRLSSYPVFETCEHFAVSILADGQQHAANVFAMSAGDRFARVDWRTDAHGCALIDGAAAHFSCAAHRRIDAGDHLVLVGRIEAFAASGRAGLGYTNGGYFSLALERRAEALAHGSARMVVGAVIEHEGRVLLAHDARGYRLPQVPVSRRSGAAQAIAALFAGANLAVRLGPVFSIFDDTATGDTYTYYRGAAQVPDTGGLGSYVPVHDLAALPFAWQAERTMVERYVMERAIGHFGLYLGDELQGDVQAFAEGPHA